MSPLSPLTRDAVAITIDGGERAPLDEPLAPPLPEKLCGTATMLGIGFLVVIPMHEIVKLCRFLVTIRSRNEQALIEPLVMPHGKPLECGLVTSTDARPAAVSILSPIRFGAVH